MTPIILSAFAAVASLFAFLAQFSTEQDPTGILNQMWPIVGVFVPFIAARIVNAEARAWFKFGMALAIATIAGGLTMLEYDWSDLVTSPVGLLAVAERVGSVFGVAQTVFFMTDQYFKADTGAGLNDQDFAKPDKGLGYSPRPEGLL